MARPNRTTTKTRHRSRSIEQMSYIEARRFLLKEDSYCEFDMPVYFKFKKMLDAVDKVLKGKNLNDYRRHSPSRHDGINHTLLNNKDGKYAWRPLELIHPALYVSLVDRITQRDAWKEIRDRLRTFRALPNIECLSLPVKSLTSQKDTAEQIYQWWQGIEQKSIELSLDYQYILRTDITDCYAAIYTHTIAWALHTKQIAKQRRKDNNLIGNVIDQHIQDMRNGQTNGIPQGSALMDLMAELVLGYADTELALKIAASGIDYYRILRFRDDYRIFVNSPTEGDIVLKCLTEVMIDLGLKLNPEKTDASSDIIHSSIKDDKLTWMLGKQNDRDLQKHLLLIHNHGKQYPNSGTLEVAMKNYSQRLRRVRRYGRPLPLISIVTDIAYQNPRTYRISAAILSQLFRFLANDSERLETVNKIVRRFKQLPNTGHMELWLQRISLEFNSGAQFNERLCQLLDLRDGHFWNNQWISNASLRTAIDSNDIVDWKILDGVSPIIPPDESELFAPDAGPY